MLDAHGMDPVKVLALAAQLGPVPERILVVGCEPQVRMTGDEEELVGDLSEPVRAALGPRPWSWSSRCSPRCCRERERNGGGP